MAIRQSRQYLVCYDIADPKRLGRVYRLLCREAIPLQYSVFVTYRTRDSLISLLQQVGEEIEIREDDVRAYPLPERFDAETYGIQRLPEGADLRDGGRSLSRLVHLQQTAAEANSEIDQLPKLPETWQAPPQTPAGFDEMGANGSKT